MKGKNFKKLWYLVPSISLILAIMFPNSSVKQLLIRIVLYGFFIIYLRFLINREHKDLIKFNHKSFSNLYLWADQLDGAHLHMYELLKKHPVEQDILANLLKIKSGILIYCNHDIRKLRLLKSYFIVLKEDKEKEFYYKSIIGILVATGLFIIRQIILTYGGEKMINVMASFGFYDFLFIVFTFFAFMTRIIFLGNKRLQLFQRIIEQCIEEFK